MTRRFKHASAMSAVAVAIGALAAMHPARLQAEESHYKLACALTHRKFSTSIKSSTEESIRE